MKRTPAARATCADQVPYWPEPRSIWPSFQRLRTVSESTIGVAPFAFVSAIILRRYQPNECTTSCRFVIRLSIATESSPIPGSEPRARSVSLIAPPSLWPNSISTTSPGFTSAISWSHNPSLTKVRLLRPPRARFTTFTFVVSKYAANGTPQPCCRSPVPRAAVELPAMTIDGRAMLGADGVRMADDADAAGAEDLAQPTTPRTPAAPAISATAADRNPLTFPSCSPGDRARSPAPRVRSRPSAPSGPGSCAGGCDTPPAPTNRCGA